MLSTVISNRLPSRILLIFPLLDALPDIGHACGHNLIAISSLGAALATAATIDKLKLGGKVFLVGTPAEEGGKYTVVNRT